MLVGGEAERVRLPTEDSTQEAHSQPPRQSLDKDRLILVAAIIDFEITAELKLKRVRVLLGRTARKGPPASPHVRAPA